MTTPNRRIRVCQMVDDLHAGGAQQVVRLLVEALDRRRFESVVYTFKSGPLIEPIQRSGVDVRVLERTVPKIDLGLVGRLRRALADDSVDVLHMHLFGATLHGTLAASRITDLARVVSLHSDREDNVLQRLAYPLLFSASDAVVGVSGDASFKMLGRYPDLRDKLVTIPNGINTAAFKIPVNRHRLFHALKLPPDARVIGAVGRLSREKGYQVLLEAFSQVKAQCPEAFLIVVGDGDLREALAAHTIDLGIDASVRYLGARSDVPELLQIMDVFALSSLWEGLPLVLLEAMAAGVPVVSSAVGGIPEVIRDGHEGLLVPPSDATSLATALLRVLGDSTLADRLRVAASAIVRSRYRIEDMTRRHEVIYARVHSLGDPRIRRQSDARVFTDAEKRPSEAFGA